MNGRASIDLIFTDIIGLQKIRKQLKSFYIDNWCRFRVLDSFGTHAEFNQPQYFRDNYKKYGAKLKSNPWGANALNLQQFLTLYPHTDDNTFLGFVVETHPVNDGIKRENITVVYGKEAYMWENSSKILEVGRLNSFNTGCSKDILKLLYRLLTCDGTSRLTTNHSKLTHDIDHVGSR